MMMIYVRRVGSIPPIGSGWHLTSMRQDGRCMPTLQPRGFKEAPLDLLDRFIRIAEAPDSRRRR